MMMMMMMIATTTAHVSRPRVRSKMRISGQSSPRSSTGAAPGSGNVRLLIRDIEPRNNWAILF